MPVWLENLRRRSLVTRGAILVICVAGLLAIVAPIAYRLGGLLGLAASASACGVCLFGTGSALVVCHLLRGPNRVLYGFLIGMALRMGVPLMFGLACYLHGGGLFIAGFPYYLLVFYPVALTVETIMSLPLDERSDNVSQNLVL